METMKSWLELEVERQGGENWMNKWVLGQDEIHKDCENVIHRPHNSWIIRIRDVSLRLWG